MNAKIRYGNSAQVQLCIHNCGQTAADRDMLTILTASELVIALSNGTVLYDERFSHNICVTDRQTDDTSYPRLDLTIGQKPKRSSILRHPVLCLENQQSECGWPVL